MGFVSKLIQPDAPGLNLNLVEIHQNLTDLQLQVLITVLYTTNSLCKIYSYIAAFLRARSFFEKKNDKKILQHLWDKKKFLNQNPEKLYENDLVWPQILFHYHQLVLQRLSLDKWFHNVHNNRQGLWLYNIIYIVMMR